MQNWMLWLFYILDVAITVITKAENVLFFVVAGMIYMIVKAPPDWIRKPRTVNTVILLSGIGFWSYESGTLWDIALFFAEAGAFVFGSGLAIVPFLHGGVVVDQSIC